MARWGVARANVRKIRVGSDRAWVIFVTRLPPSKTGPVQRLAEATALERLWLLIFWFRLPEYLEGKQGVFATFDTFDTDESCTRPDSARNARRAAPATDAARLAGVRRSSPEFAEAAAEDRQPLPFTAPMPPYLVGHIPSSSKAE